MLPEERGVMCWKVSPYNKLSNNEKHHFLFTVVLLENITGGRSLCEVLHDKPLSLLRKKMTGKVDSALSIGNHGWW